MELREYGQIVRRRIWIPIVLTLLVAGLSAVQLRPWEQKPPSGYNTEIRLLLGVAPMPNADVASYDPRYFAWLISEYLVDDFTEVVRSQHFATGISARLGEEGITVPAGAITGSATTGKQHRIIRLNFSWPNESEALAIANAAAEELRENASLYFVQLGTDDTIVEILDGPNIGAIGASALDRYEFPLRVLLALLAGLGLAFLVDYLDDSIRNRRDLETLGFVTIGLIPKHK